MTKVKYVSCILLLMVVGCSPNQLIIPGKPDLKIDTITYTRLPNVFVFKGSSSGVLGLSRFQFTVQVGNVGSADLAEPIYVANSRSTWDFDNQYCSHEILVNYSPCIPIPVGGSIQVTFEDVINDSTPYVLFVINTNDRFDRGVPLPKIDELSYDNDDYDLAMKW